MSSCASGKGFLDRFGDLGLIGFGDSPKIAQKDADCTGPVGSVPELVPEVVEPVDRLQHAVFVPGVPQQDRGDLCEKPHGSREKVCVRGLGQVVEKKLEVRSDPRQLWDLVDDRIDQVEQAGGGGPPGRPVIDDERNDRRQHLRGRLLLATLHPNADQVARQLKAHPTIRIALVLEQEVDEAQAAQRA